MTGLRSFPSGVLPVRIAAMICSLVQSPSPVSLSGRQILADENAHSGNREADVRPAKIALHVRRAEQCAGRVAIRAAGDDDEIACRARLGHRRPKLERGGSQTPQGRDEGHGEEGIASWIFSSDLGRAEGAPSPDMGNPSNDRERAKFASDRACAPPDRSSPPRHAHHLRGLVSHHVPAFRRQRAQARRYMRRNQVMKDHHRGRFEVGGASERIVGRGLAVVIAVNERERPSRAQFAEAYDRAGARFGNKDRGRAARRRRGSPARIHAASPRPRAAVRRRAVAQSRRRRDRRSTNRARRRSRSRSAPERARVGVEDRGFVAIDEADGRITSVDPKRMVDLLAKIGPSRSAFVRLNHVRKQMIENRRFEIGGDVVFGHAIQAGARERNRPRGDEQLILARRARQPEANATPRCLASRTAVLRGPAGAAMQQIVSTCTRLVLALPDV